MPIFQIETYKVSSYLERFTSESRPSRVLEMTGPVLYHGIQNRASFAFSLAFDGVWNSPVSGYLTDGGYSGLYVVGWFPLAEFTYYYDILRSERPIHVLYEFRDIGATAGYLKKVGLGTSVEEIGEGPSDSEPTLASLALEHFLPGLSMIRGTAQRNIKHLVPMPTTEDLSKRRS